jgi:hypothetical protein
MNVTEDLRLTLLICKDALPGDVHAIHTARLQLIWAIVQWAIKEEPQHWQAALERAEKAVDAALAARVRP